MFLWLIVSHLYLCFWRECRSVCSRLRRSLWSLTANRLNDSLHFITNTLTLTPLCRRPRVLYTVQVAACTRGLTLLIINSIQLTPFSRLRDTWLSRFTCCDKACAVSDTTIPRFVALRRNDATVAELKKTSTQSRHYDLQGMRYHTVSEGKKYMLTKSQKTLKSSFVSVWKWIKVRLTC